MQLKDVEGFDQNESYELLRFNPFAIGKDIYCGKWKWIFVVEVMSISHLHFLLTHKKGTTVASSQIDSWYFIHD